LLKLVARRGAELAEEEGFRYAQMGATEARRHGGRKEQGLLVGRPTIVEEGFYFCELQKK
jgi:hypothetical protein